MDFKPVGEGHLIATFDFLTVNDELLGESAYDVAGDVAGHEGDGQAVGTFHLFPDAFGIELDDGAVSEQGFVLFAVDVGEVDGA